MIRLILVCIFLLIIFVLSLILFPIEWLIGRISPKAKDISSLRFVQFVFKVILFLSGVNTTVIGLENIPKDEPVVFIGNHRGFTAACRVLQVLLPKKRCKKFHL